jgi:hypothetical protein
VRREEYGVCFHPLRLHRGKSIYAKSMEKQTTPVASTTNKNDPERGRCDSKHEFA